MTYFYAIGLNMRVRSVPKSQSYSGTCQVFHARRVCSHDRGTCLLSPGGGDKRHVPCPRCVIPARNNGWPRVYRSQNRYISSPITLCKKKLSHTRRGYPRTQRVHRGAGPRGAREGSVGGAGPRAPATSERHARGGAQGATSSQWRPQTKGREPWRKTSSTTSTPCGTRSA